MSEFQYGLHVMREVFAQCGGNAISDIQLRTDRLAYIHTKKGLEIVYPLGELPHEVVLDVAEILYSRQEPDLFADADDKAEASLPLMTRLAANKVADFSCGGFPMADGHLSGRMRVQVHLSNSGMGVTCRLLNDGIADIEQLGISLDTVESLRAFMTRRQGLGLVTGQTGSGKSTTLAALLDWLRVTHPRHIVSVEDPIEYTYPHDMEDPNNPGHRCSAPGFVTQQEVGKHVKSYQQGLKDVLRKAPHVILIGEVRDRAAMETCIEAAQTGHVVITTLHTNGAVKTLARILEMFPHEQHASILGRMADILMFILSQGLIPGESGRVLNYEYLQNTEAAVRSGIASYDGGAKSLEDVIRQSGNVAWDNNLRNLYERGLVSYDAYRNNMMNPDEDESNLFASAV